MFAFYNFLNLNKLKKSNKKKRNMVLYSLKEDKFNA